ncbi:hypothetical protein CH339_15670 [Rhodobium orientis]|uniref:HTH luxR-type domain-containing protein n=2 Tax=Rhodobium orientis TaxID=34017 RepID=A0A327JRW0_9HYPH|nr:hypothetical protein [Rhodobium orientis]RAI26098.1 hypothetical protein CH339_15670 [Rhodobium orientis]
MTMDDIKHRVASIRDATDPAAVFGALGDAVRALGGSRMFLTGLPMPGRTLEMLILYSDWPGLAEPSMPLPQVRPDDPALELALIAHWPFVIAPEQACYDELKGSRFCEAESPEGAVIVAPFQSHNPYQGVLIAGGLDHRPGGPELGAMNDLTMAAFSRLLGMDEMMAERAGGLSPRERRVVELTAFGKTASEIAEMLQISHRTVHAHLQNASGKLDARNKTQTVVEAIRYGQISLAASLAKAPPRTGFQYS